MKKLLLIVFKIAEICLAIAVYLGMSYIGCLVDRHLLDGDNLVWYNAAYFALTIAILGIICLIFIVVCYAIMEWIPDWIALNKRWVDKILKK